MKPSSYDSRHFNSQQQWWERYFIINNQINKINNYLGSLCAVYLMIYSGEMKGKRERGERREMSECSNKHLLLKSKSY